MRNRRNIIGHSAVDGGSNKLDFGRDAICQRFSPMHPSFHIRRQEWAPLRPIQPNYELEGPATKMQKPSDKCCLLI